jgi:hypothetical protein
MALDRRFDLRAVERRDPSRAELAAIAATARGLRGKHLLLTADGAHGGRIVSDLVSATGQGDIAIYVPPGEERAVASVLRRLRVGGGNLYSELARDGAVVISPAAQVGDGVLLAGGSFSTVSLTVTDTAAVVHKRVRRAQTEGVDREVRHRQEARWLASLPPDMAQLFPPVRRVVDDRIEVGADFDFVPAYTLAELVFQERLDGAGLASFIEHIYTTLQSRLYHARSSMIAGSDSTGYLERIARRSEAIVASGHPARARVIRLLEARSVRVNGRSVIPLADVLRIVATESRWGPLRQTTRSHIVHGDLILEDILADTNGPAGFRLVDPNPSIGHPMFDVSKTMLSLWLRYEFVYFDLFGVAVDEGPAGSIDIELRFDRPWCQDQYAIAADRFLSFVQQELAGLLGFESGQVPRLIRMAAALQALAIPMFHLLHHGREARAIAFVALGLLGATETLQAETLQ